MRRLAILLGVLGLAGAGIYGLDRAFPPDLSRLDAIGTEVLDRNGRLVAMLPAPGGVWRFKATTTDVAPVLIDTLVRTEDRRFWWHPGVDPIGLLRAAVQDVRARRIVSGGSTITMQAVRLLNPHRRSWGGKIVEIVRALQLEAHFSKSDILGMWLTLAPYGGNLEGVQAGAMAWLGQSPRLLDASQAALLVAIPRRPEALRPDRHAARAAAVRDRVLRASGGPMSGVRQAFPRHAGLALAGLPRGGVVATTLDVGLQTELERMAAARTATLPPQAALAMVVADKDGGILAAVTGGRGSLDLTRAVRSPGSALKPFIYAMAFSDGIAGPSTPLQDLPRRFGQYAPENFDRGFSGAVTAGDALRQSLNLPAVELLQSVGPLRFFETLRQAGVVLRMRPGADASLPLALGGAGVTLRETAGLYTALAGNGTVAPLHLQGSVAHKTLMSQRTATEVADVLTQPFPDGGPSGVAWKTGTSWGGRDAWSVGFDSAHIAAVWVGRADGTPMADATGRSLALPILGQVFSVLPATPRHPVPPPAAVAKSLARVPEADGLRMLFPPPEAVLRGDGPVVVRAMGGRRPLVFMVDGNRLAANPARREAAWSPQTPGFYKITILDADGAAAHASVRVK